MPPNSQTGAAPFTGGCQCGAVRFAVGRLGRGSICHCRMCQKAFGGFFGPLISSYDVTWTRGAPTYFESSDKIRRGFCNRCGTPLTYEEIGRPPEQQVEIAIGAFDDPTVAAPVIQVNLTDKLPFFDGLTSLPIRTEYSAGWLEFMETLVSHQHPDHDTDTWPPQGGFSA
ncbi:GFA family protein [Devosia sp.]|uniref:GFA family protein n=1 Tax=Devosia sp. TaxID=1871048 RepID=UPI0035B3886C